MKSVRSTCAVAMILALSVSAVLAKKKDEPKAESAKVVDAGSFGIYVSGKRVATETFRIEQGNSISTAKSEFTTDKGMSAARQESELQIGANGELRRYQWHELAPEKSELVVEPSDEFLVEHILPAPPEKTSNQTFLLSNTTTILDDYVFSQRELLLWKYLAQACGTQLEGCSLPQITFGALIPTERISVSVAISYKGKQTLSIKGTEQQLDRFELSVEGDVWQIYLDSNVKIVKIVIPANNTEVVRD